jgi:hypothetical protein
MSDLVFQDSRAEAAELGAQLHGAGLRTGSVRRFVDRVSDVAQQVTLSMTPALLEELRLINQDQFADAYDRITRLPARLGHVDRAQVLLILQSVFNNQPGR